MSHDAFQIDAEIEALIPPLRPEERAQLEASIAAEGIREPVLIWDGLLIDGHNRASIARALGLPVPTRRMILPDREAAILWVYENQLGRRNLTDDQRAVLAYAAQQQRSKVARAQQAREARAAVVDRYPVSKPLSDVSDDVADTSLPTPPAEPKRDTRRETAREFGLSERKLKQVRVLEQAAPEVLPAVRAGEVTLAEAVREVTRREVVDRLESVAAREAKAAAGVYDVLVIDPPWPMEKIERDVRPLQAAFDYPTMTEPELAALSLPMAEDCHVWLWTTHKFLPMAFRLLDAWGLRYVCTFVWHKPGGFQPIGLPQYNGEFALYARRGSPTFLDTKAFPTVFQAPRGAHSEKPELFYDVVRRVTGGRRLDMFNRRVIAGFDGWGLEAAS